MLARSIMSKRPYSLFSIVTNRINNDLLIRRWIENCPIARFFVPFQAWNADFVIKDVDRVKLFWTRCSKCICATVFAEIRPLKDTLLICFLIQGHLLFRPVQGPDFYTLVSGCKHRVLMINCKSFVLWVFQTGCS